MLTHNYLTPILGEGQEGDESWMPILHSDDLDRCHKRWYAAAKCTKSSTGCAIAAASFVGILDVRCRFAICRAGLFGGLAPAPTSTFKTGLGAN